MGREEEKLIKKFLGQFGMEAKKFSKEERRVKKTPDYKVFRGPKLCFYCEEKTIDARSEESPAKPRMDRIADKIHEAVVQFDSVNPRMNDYNVLAICNKDKDLNHLNLLAYLGGLKVTDGRSVFGVSPPLGDAKNRIKDKKARIHLYIWIDLFQSIYKNPFCYYTRIREKVIELESYFELGDPL